MRKSTFTIPHEELALVEANLAKCPGLELTGTNCFQLDGRQYCDLFLQVEQPESLYQLGNLVGRALEQQEAERLAYPEQLSEPLGFVLGRPNFWCGSYAHLFRAAGHAINPKAEDEQAFVLHWLTKMVLRHGDQWADYAQRDLDALKSQLPPQPGESQAA